jgi:hypothetical protein
VQRAVQGLRLAPDELAAAAQAARVRVVALGWLHSIGSHTAQREYHSEDRAALAYTACVALLEHVVQLHPHLHQRVRAARACSAACCRPGAGGRLSRTGAPLLPATLRSCSCARRLPLQVVSLLLDSLLAMGSTRQELVKLQLDLLARLLAMGQVEAVMACIAEWVPPLAACCLLPAALLEAPALVRPLLRRAADG